MRWTDDRLDDLHTLVTGLQSKVERNSELTRSHDRDLREIARTGDRRRDSNLTLKVGIILLLLSQLGQYIHDILHATGAG